MHGNQLFLIAGGLAIIVVQLVWLWAIVRKGHERAAQWIALRRRGNDMRPGPAWLEVTAVRDINLGVSEETGKNPSGTPKLVTEDVELQVVDGPYVRVAAGKTLQVQKLAGASRKLLEAVTAASGGTVSRLTFEVRAGKRFWLAASIPDRTGQAAPFRDDSGTVALEPLGEAYLLHEDGPQPYEWAAAAIGYSVGAFAFGGALVGGAWKTGGPGLGLIAIGAVAGIGMLIGAATSRPEVPPRAPGLDGSLRSS